MFKLIALLFLVTNGVTAEKPSGALGANVVFASEQECNGFMSTATGKEANKAMKGFIASQKQKVKVKFICVKVDGVKNPDDTI